MLNHKRQTLNLVVHRLQDVLQLSPVCVSVGMNRFSPYVRDEAGRAQRDEVQLLVFTKSRSFCLLFPKISALSHLAAWLDMCLCHWMLKHSQLCSTAIGNCHIHERFILFSPLVVCSKMPPSKLWNTGMYVFSPCWRFIFFFPYPLPQALVGCLHYALKLGCCNKLLIFHSIWQNIIKRLH